MADSTEDLMNLRVSLAKIDVVVQKLDKTTEQLTQISKDVSNILAVHEEKLNYGDRYFEEVKSQLTTLLTTQGNLVATISDDINEKIEKLVAERIAPLEETVGRLQKLVWIASGVGATIMFLIEFFAK